MQNKKKVIGYCRVSTENQRETGNIEIQVKAIKEYCDEHGFELKKIFKDIAVSGGLDERDGLSLLFNHIEEENSVEFVIITKLDRLARDLHIQETLIKKLELLGKKLVSITEPNLNSNDPMRKAFRQLLGIVSELEKSFITMRLSSGRINKAKKGGFAGGSIAYGYKKKGKKLIIDQDSQDIIQRIFHMKRYRRMGYNKIARELNRLKVKTARGGKWYAGTVRYIIKNSVYKGKLEYKNVSTQREDLALIKKK